MARVMRWLILAIVTFMGVSFLFVLLYRVVPVPVTATRLPARALTLPAVPTRRPASASWRAAAATPARRSPVRGWLTVR